ncbi:hypothetical protein L3Q82_013553, partial [Scortum barcoo]
STAVIVVAATVLPAVTLCTPCRVTLGTDGNHIVGSARDVEDNRFDRDEVAECISSRLSHDSVCNEKYMKLESLVMVAELRTLDKLLDINGQCQPPSAHRHQQPEEPVQ